MPDDVGEGFRVLRGVDHSGLDPDDQFLDQGGQVVVPALQGPSNQDRHLSLLDGSGLSWRRTLAGEGGQSLMHVVRGQLEPLPVAFHEVGVGGVGVTGSGRDHHPHHLAPDDVPQDHGMLRGPDGAPLDGLRRERKDPLDVPLSSLQQGLHEPRGCLLPGSMTLNWREARDRADRGLGELEVQGVFLAVVQVLPDQNLRFSAMVRQERLDRVRVVKHPMSFGDVGEVQEVVDAGLDGQDLRLEVDTDQRPIS